MAQRQMRHGRRLWRCKGADALGYGDAARMARRFPGAGLAVRRVGRGRACTLPGATAAAQKPCHRASFRDGNVDLEAKN